MVYTISDAIHNYLGPAASAWIRIGPPAAAGRAPTKLGNPMPVTINTAESDVTVGKGLYIRCMSKSKAPEDFGSDPSAGRAANNCQFFFSQRVSSSMWASIIQGIVWWSLFLQVGPLVWYMPLENMDLTGFESIMLFPLLMPSLFLMLCPSVTESPRVHRWMRGLAALGIVAPRYLSKRLMIEKAIIVAASSGLMLASHWATIGDSGWGIVIAMAIVCSVKLPFLSLNPFFTNTGANIGLFLLALWTSYNFSTTGTPSDSSEKDQPNRLIFSVGFGSLFFLSHWFSTAPSVLARWFSVPPYPLNLYVSCAVFAGLFVGVILCRASRMAQKAVLVLPLCLSLTLIHVPLVEFQFIVLLPLFVSSFVLLWVPAINNLAQIITFKWLVALVAMLTWFLHFLGSVWTVAYNFVPVGGEYTREQTWLHLHVVCALAPLAALRWPRTPPPPRFVTGLFIVALFILVPSVFFRVQSQTYPSSVESFRDQRIVGMIWAVHFGYDNYGRNSFAAIEQKIRDTQANVIGLLESDVSRPFNNNWDIVQYLEQQLGFYSDFGPSTLNNTWGCALLSAFPILHSEHVLLPSPEGELACLIDATLDVGDGLPGVHVLVTHFGNFRDWKDRQLQAAEVANMLQRADPATPYLFLGYLTTNPNSPNFRMLTDAGWKDTAPHEKRRWCEFVLYRGLEFRTFERINTDWVSDTEIQRAVFRLPHY